MKTAWNYFNEIWEHEEVEYDSTFAHCLKISWKVAKEEMEEAKEREAQLSKSEYVKAFDWACRKAYGVRFFCSNWIYVVCERIFRCRARGG